MTRSNTIFPKTFLSLMTVTFAVAVLGLVYGVANAPTQLRSKAAEDGHIYESWEFDDTSTTGGWTGQGVGLSVFGGMLNIARLKNPRQPPQIETPVTATLPAGKKLLQVNLAVGANLNPTLGVEDDKNTPRASETMQTGTKTFVIPITYQIRGNSFWQKPLLLLGQNDGKFMSYSLDLTDSSELEQLKITKLRLDLSKLAPADFIKIDSIRLVGTYK